MCPEIRAYIKTLGVTDDNVLDAESHEALIGFFKDFYAENKASFKLDAAYLHQLNQEVFDSKSSYQKSLDHSKTFEKPENYDQSIITAIETNMKQVDNEHKAKALAVESGVNPKLYNGRLNLFNDLKHFDKDSLNKVDNANKATMSL